ncbi:MAG: Ig domain-containing protein, partial [Noviherbaspirillum sp.]
SGNPVPEVTVIASIIPVVYKKGTYRFDADIATPESGWVFASPHYVCANEDVNLNGVLDAGEDANNSGALEPRIPLSVTPSAKTDASGTAVVSILYPRDRGNWTAVRLKVRGSVAGTEATYQTATYTLPVLASDMTDATVSPPGMPSPYGVNACNVAN